MNKKYILILIGFTLLLLIAEYLFTENSGLFTRQVIMIGTFIVADITLLAYVISYSSSLKKNPNQFVRGVMGATFLKFFLCAIAVLIYLLVVRKQLHKPDLYFLMLVYVIFTILENVLLSQAVKSKPEQIKDDVSGN